MRILVLGGTGLLGRHVAAALRARGHRVVIGTRRPRRALAQLPPALRDLDLRELHLESLTTRYVWAPVLAGFDAVVNAAGLRRERGGETWERVELMAPAALAEACARLGKRLVHVSALGLRPEVRHPRLRAKLLAERQVLASGAEASVVRPALLHDGQGRAWLRRAALWPVHFLPAGAAGRIAPLDARDAGEAVAALCERPAAEFREVELGGAARRSLAEHLDALRSLEVERPALRIAVPAPAARLFAAACDALRLTPFSAATLEWLRRDLAPADNALPRLLGRAPLAVGRGSAAAARAYPEGATPA